MYLGSVHWLYYRESVAIGLTLTYYTSCHAEQLWGFMGTSGSPLGGGGPPDCKISSCFACRLCLMLSLSLSELVSAHFQVKGGNQRSVDGNSSQLQL